MPKKAMIGMDTDSDSWWPADLTFPSGLLAFRAKKHWKHFAT
jgi:hypothetical protein